MGRWFLLAFALFVTGIAVSTPRETGSRQLAAAVRPTQNIAPPPLASRPGEPMLVPGQSIDLRRAADGHFYANTTVNGQPVAMLVDTGASTVALTIGDAQRLGLAIDPATFQVVGTGASGPVRGAAVMLDGVTLAHRQIGPIAAVVLEGLDRSLLGQTFLSRMDSVQIAGDTMTLR